MKTIAISILAVVMMTLGIGKAWAICQPDDDECYCRTHPGECDDAPPPPPDYSAAAYEKAVQTARLAHPSLPTALEIEEGCGGWSNTGGGYCAVRIYLEPNSMLTLDCEVYWGLDGWGSTVVEVQCNSSGIEQCPSPGPCPSL